MKQAMRRIMAAVLLCALVPVLLCGCNEEKVKVMFNDYQGAGGQIGTIKTAAVLDFLGKNPGNGEELSDLVAQKIAGMGYWQIMDRNESRRILRSQGLPTEGIVNADDAVKIARALNVDALIFGLADANFSSQVRYREDYYANDGYYRGRRRRYSSYSRTYYRDPYLNRSGRVSLSIHFFDAKLGREMGSILLAKSYSQDFSSYYASQVRFSNYYYYDRLQQNQMPGDIEMIYLLADHVLNRLVGGFLPEYISRTRVLGEAVPGVDLARDGKWDEARKVWDKSFSGTKLDKNVNLNLGIYYERLGNAARALTYYQEALKIDPEDEVIKGYAEEAGKAAAAQDLVNPLSISDGEVRFRVSDVKDDGRVYVNAGQEEGIQPGDKFIIARAKAEFYNDLITPRKNSYYQVGELTIEKVFEGVSQGVMSGQRTSRKPAPGDGAMKIMEAAPPPQAPPADEAIKEKEATPPL
jgi:tetratricopeptide (TPR) repeat protein